jgi:O-antigen/teichoic acid export membrane protein
MSKSKNIILLTFGRGFNGLLTLFLVPYMARALDYEDYATYGQVLLVIEIMMVLLNIAANQYIYVLFSENKFSKKDVVFNAVILNIVLSIFGIGFIFLFKNFIGLQFKNPEITQNIALYVFSLPFLLILSTINFVYYFNNQFKRSIVYEVIINALRLSSIIIAVQVFRSLQLIFVFLLAVNVLSVLIYHIKLPINYFKGKLNKALIIKFLKYGYPLGITAILGILLKRTDAVMVSSMLTPKDYAIYRMGAIEIPFLMTVFSSVMTVTLPNVTKLYHEGKFDEIIALKRKAITTSALVMYPVLIFILVFSEPLLTLYLGEKYKASIPVFVIYNLILFFRVNDYEDILIASSKTRMIGLIYFIVFLLNIFYTYIFIQYFGIIGAALGTLLSLSTYMFIIYLANKNIICYNRIFNTKKIFFILLISICLAYLSKFIKFGDNHLINLGVSVIFYTISIIIVFRLTKLMPKEFNIKYLLRIG